MPGDPINVDRDRSRSGDAVEVDLFCLGAVMLVALGVLQFLEGIYSAISVFPEPFSIFNRFLSELGCDSKASEVNRNRQVFFA